MLYSIALNFYYRNKAIYITICTNLIVQVSRIQGHKIHIILYARLDSGNCRFY